MLLTFTVKYAYIPDFAIKKKSRWEKTIAWCIHCLVCHLHHNINEHGHEFLATNGWSAFIASMHDCAWYDRSTNFVEHEVNVPRTIAVRRYGESYGRRKRHVVKPSTTLSQTWYTVIEYHEYLDLSVIRRSITRRCRGQRQIIELRIIDLICKTLTKFCKTSLMKLSFYRNASFVMQFTGEMRSSYCQHRQGTKGV